MTYNITDNVRFVKRMTSVSVLTAVFFLLSSVSWAQELYLDELDLSKTTCGWRQTAANQTVDGSSPLSIAGQKYTRGVGHHAPGDIVIKLPGRCGTRFTAQVGIDDEVGQLGHAEFLVFGNNKLLWRSDAMVGGQAAKSIDLDISQIDTLRLHCDTLPEGYGHDHQDWAEAKITYKGNTKPFTVLVNSGLFDENGDEVDRMDEIACEWLSLTQQLRAGMRDNVAAEALDPASTLLPDDRDPLDIIVRRLPPLIEHLRHLPNGPKLDSEAAEVAQFIETAKNIPVEKISERKDVFAKVIALRKRISFQNPLLSFTDILFIKRHFNPEPEMQGNHMCDQFFGFNGRQGGGVFVLKNAFTQNPSVVNVLNNQKIQNGRYEGVELDKTWAYLSPEISYDNREIMFAATDAKEPRHTYTQTESNSYHIFRMSFDPATGLGSSLVQLTDGAFNDFDPCYLPSGRVAFISERRGGYGRCHGRPVPSYTLHSMNPDGSDIVTLSPHETNEWQPDVDHNGMIIYTRWDYVDRGFNQAHHPWITTPDGRDPRVIQGNYDRVQGNRPHFECDIHPIPGSYKITATASCHHGQSYGSLILIDPKVPDSNEPGQIKRITPDQMFPESEVATHRDPCNYATCWPLSEYFYICVYDAFSKSNAGPANNYGIYLLDAFGNRTLLYRDPEISCRDAMPLRTRTRQTIVPHLTMVGKPLAEGEKYEPIDPATLPKTATVGLINVYDSMFPFPAAENGQPTQVKRLRIVQLLPKTNPYAHNPAIGYGDQKGARKILGTIPVEKDGSAFFNLPVNIPVYFQALDEKGVAIQTMRSATYVHEGEQLTCQGCHENRHSSMANRPVGIPAAMRRPASNIVPDPEGTNPLSYVRLIQPILDEKCVDCHAKSTDPKAIDLSAGDTNRHFFQSYENLRKFCFYYNDASWTEAQTFPGKFGSHRSQLFQILKSDHYGLKLTEEQMYRFTTWMDNNCDFYGSYDDCPLQRTGAVVEPTLE